MPTPPPFARGRQWRWRASHAKRIRHRVWYDATTGYEYEPDPRPPHDRWHEVNPRTGEYRDVDRESGQPVAGREGQWRPLK